MRLRYGQMNDFEEVELLILRKLVGALASKSSKADDYSVALSVLQEISTEKEKE